MANKYLKRFNLKKFKALFRNKKLLVVFMALLTTLVISSATYALVNNNTEPEVVEVSEPTEQQEEPEVESEEEPPETPAPVELEPTPKPEPEPVSPWPVTFSLDQAFSLTVVVNKKHKLPSNYVPSLTGVAGGQMRPEAASALNTMLQAAQNDGVPMKIISSYRSYPTQVSTYNKWVRIDGQAQADRSSARPGHSEHQTGLAVDLGVPNGNCDLLICFGSTAQGQWLATYAQKYGFIVRYESNTEAITGYQYEPWHMRYLGVSTATAVKNSGQTLDQYYGVEAGGY